MKHLILALTVIFFSCTKKMKETNVQSEIVQEHMNNSEQKKEQKDELLNNNPNSEVRSELIEAVVEKKETHPIITVPALKPDSLPSLEQFKKDHPDVKVKIEKLDSTQMNSNAIQSMEEFKKAHPEVKVQINKMDQNEMIPMQ